MATCFLSVVNSERAAYKRNQLAISIQRTRARLLSDIVKQFTPIVRFPQFLLSTLCLHTQSLMIHKTQDVSGFAPRESKPTSLKSRRASDPSSPFPLTPRDRSPSADKNIKGVTVEKEKKSSSRVTSRRSSASSSSSSSAPQLPVCGSDSLEEVKPSLPLPAPSPSASSSPRKPAIPSLPLFGLKTSKPASAQNSPTTASPRKLELKSKKTTGTASPHRDQQAGLSSGALPQNHQGSSENEASALQHHHHHQDHQPDEEDESEDHVSVNDTVNNSESEIKKFWMMRRKRTQSVPTVVH